MLEYVQHLYMHEGVAPMVANIETSCNTCIDLEDVNKGTKKMADGKVVDVTLIASKFLKWTMPSTRHWIMTIIDQAIKQGLPNDWLMNWI